MLWLGLALSLAAGASIHSQQAAMPVGHEQVVADGTVGIPPYTQLADGTVGIPPGSVVA
jgi:hypothetical protein